MNDAAEVLRAARMRLMLDQPFLASSIATFPVVLVPDRSWCPAMATNGIHIFVNPMWVLARESWELEFVIAHEVLHCLLGHIDRRGDRHVERWNMAIDYATNALLIDCGLRMPGEGLYSRDYVGLPAEVIYDRLGGTGSWSRKMDRFDSHLEVDGLETAEVGQEELPTADERLRLRARLNKDAETKIPGSIRGYWELEIEAASLRQVPWRELLARFVSGLRQNDYRTFPFNKKHLWRGLYIPSVGVPSPEHLVVAVDTSGSMDKAEIAQVLAEVDSLRSVTGCRLTLIEADAEIQRITEFGPVEESDYVAPRKVAGRGGTDFRPVFSWAERELRNGNALDALVYLTDGYGPAPDAPPNFPLLWIVTPAGQKGLPWGQVIELH